MLSSAATAARVEGSARIILDKQGAPMFSSLRWAIALLLPITFAAAQLRPAQVFILIGPPGSGKSVQAKRLSRQHKVPDVSMSALLQREIGRRTPTGRALASSLASGELVNDQAANDLMKARILRSDASNGFILDGYPSTAGQAKALDEFLQEHSFPKPIVVVIEATDEIIRSRMNSRGRADDEPQNIERRIREYRELGSFAENWYGAENTVRVDGAGSVDQVALSITQKIDETRSRKGLSVRPRPN